ncbi:MAG: hypothetical protein AAB416_04700 [Patescibacteria group bacterium]
MAPRAPRRSPAPRRKKAAAKNVPENLPLIEDCTPSVCSHRVFHFEHLFALSAAFIFVFSVLFTVSTASKAQEFKTAISAEVLPLEMYSTYKLKPENAWETYWKSLDATTKLMIQSGAGLAGVLIPLGAILWYQQRHVHKALPSPVSIAGPAKA